jgi:hypothetical protein
MTLRNWGRDYDREEARQVKYAWQNKENTRYFIRVLDLEKVLGRYHEDYDRRERYAVELIYVADLDQPERVDDMTITYRKRVAEAYNTATDIAESYPDAVELDEDVQEEEVSW